IIVVGDARYFTVPYIEKCACRKAVFLPLCLRQPLVRHEILAIDNKLRTRALAVFACHNDDITQPLAIAAVHMSHELCKSRLTFLPFALVDIVYDIIRQKSQKSIHVLTIECFIISTDCICSVHGRGPVVAWWLGLNPCRGYTCQQMYKKQPTTLEIKSFSSADIANYIDDVARLRI